MSEEIKVEQSKNKKIETTNNSAEKKTTARDRVVKSLDSFYRFIVKDILKMNNKSIVDEEIEEDLDNSDSEYDDFDFKQMIASQDSEKNNENKNDNVTVIEDDKSNGMIDSTEHIALCNTPIDRNKLTTEKQVRAVSRAPYVRAVIGCSVRKALNRALSVITGRNRDNLKLEVSISTNQDALSNEWDIPLVRPMKAIRTKNSLVLANSDATEVVKTEEFNRDKHYITKYQDIYSFRETLTTSESEIIDVKGYNEIIAYSRELVKLMKIDAVDSVMSKIYDDFDIDPDNYSEEGLTPEDKVELDLAKKEVYRSSALVVKKRTLFTDPFENRLKISDPNLEDETVKDIVKSWYKEAKDAISGKPLTNTRATIGIFKTRVNIVKKEDSTYSKDPDKFRKYKSKKVDDIEYLMKIDSDRDDIHETPVDIEALNAGKYDEYFLALERAYLIWSENEARGLLGFNPIDMSLDLNIKDLQSKVKYNNLSEVLHVKQRQIVKWDRELVEEIKEATKDIDEKYMYNKVQKSASTSTAV